MWSGHSGHCRDHGDNQMALACHICSSCALAARWLDSHVWCPYDDSLHLRSERTAHSITPLPTKKSLNFGKFGWFDRLIMYMCFVCRAFMQFMLSQRWSQRKITGAQKYVERLHPLRIVTTSCQYRKGQWLSDTTLRLWKCDSHDNLYSCLNSWLSSSGMVGDPVQLHMCVFLETVLA